MGAGDPRTRLQSSGVLVISGGQTDHVAVGRQIRELLLDLGGLQSEALRPAEAGAERSDQPPVPQVRCERSRGGGGFLLHEVQHQLATVEYTVLGHRVDRTSEHRRVPPPTESHEVRPGDGHGNRLGERSAVQVFAALKRQASRSGDLGPLDPGVELYLPPHDAEVPELDAGGQCAPTDHEALVDQPPVAEGAVELPGIDVQMLFGILRPDVAEGLDAAKPQRELLLALIFVSLFVPVDFGDVQSPPDRGDLGLDQIERRLLHRHRS